MLTADQIRLRLARAKRAANGEDWDSGDHGYNGYRAVQDVVDLLIDVLPPLAEENAALKRENHLLHLSRGTMSPYTSLEDAHAAAQDARMARYADLDATYQRCQRSPVHRASVGLD